MKKDETILAPTLWRTFRALGNVNRLRCLKAVLKTPAATLEQIAGIVNISEPKASLALRSLQSRGLIASQRSSRWVMYIPDSEPSVQSAKPFLTAVKHALVTAEISEEEISQIAKSYTHPRRINIVRALASEGPISPAELSEQLQISAQALDRHLRKLRSLDVVELSSGMCVLLKPKTKLARDLLRIILA